MAAFKLAECCQGFIRARDYKRAGRFARAAHRCHALASQALHAARKTA